MVKVAGNVVPGAVGQGRVALLPGLQVARVNRTRQIRQGFGSGAQGELDGTAAGCLEHWIEPLWVSVL